MTLASGTILAGYTIDRLLGRGGMGEVYLATHEGLGRKVALKLLAPELAADAGFRQRFIAESRLAAALDHPHIVPIYEAGESDGRLFLAMRYVEGADLGAIIVRDGPLEPTRAIGLLAGIAAALDAAHDRGLIHRDVKPANILVARTSHGDEHAYLGDFGLVKQLGSDAGFTRSGQLVGSVDYIAPEQIEGRPIDHRVDVYSLACVLYTALASRPPYERESDVATLWAHVQGSVPRLSDNRPELARLDEVIATGMAKDPADRYASAGELVGAAATDVAPRRGSPGVSKTMANPPRVNRSDPLPSDLDHRAPERDHVVSRPHAATLTEIIGREDARAAVQDRLRHNRLVTITGVGGMGKTRLALSIADELGAPVVDLTAITDERLIAPEIAVTLGLHLDPARSPTEGLGDAIGEAYPLIILDNLEQVVNPADALGPLLAQAPKLRLLVTSRVPIGMLGEAELPLDPLPVTDSDDIATIEASPAGALLLQRARAIGALHSIDGADAGALAALCRRLEGIPLALELAAARLRLLSPAQVLERLIDGSDAVLEDSHRPERQRSLEAVVRWSMESTSNEQRDVLAAATICVGGFDVAMLAALVPHRDVLDDMHALISLGLIRREPGERDPRFDLLETIRAAARRNLAALQREQLEARHADHLARVVRRAGNQLDRPDSCDASVLSRERGNIRAALEWALEHDRPLALELVSRLGEYWKELGAIDEALGWLDRAGATSRGDAGMQLHAAATRLYIQNQRSFLGLAGPARALRDQAIASNDPLAATRALAQAAGAMSDIASDESESYIAEALERAEAAGLERWSSQLSIIGSMAAMNRGEVTLAKARLESAAVSARAAGDSSVEGKALGNLALIVAFHPVDVPHDAVSEPELERAVEFARRAVALIDPHDRADRAWVLGILAGLLARIDAPSGGRDELASAIELTLSIYKFPRLIGMTLSQAALVLANAGDFELALRANAAAERIEETLGFIPTTEDQRQVDLNLRSVRANLGPVRARLAEDAGRTETPEVLLREIAAALAGPHDTTESGHASAST